MMGEQLDSLLEVLFFYLSSGRVPNHLWVSLILCQAFCQCKSKESQATFCGGVSGIGSRRKLLPMDPPFSPPIHAITPPPCPWPSPAANFPIQASRVVAEHTVLLPMYNSGLEACKSSLALEPLQKILCC